MLALAAQKLSIVVRKPLAAQLDCGMTLLEAISAGKFSRVSPDVFSVFQGVWTKGKKSDRHPVLISISRWASTAEIIALLNDERYRPATASEGLAFAVAYRDQQRIIPIAVLGQFGQFKPRGDKYALVFCKYEEKCVIVLESAETS